MIVQSLKLKVKSYRLKLLAFIIFVLTLNFTLLIFNSSEARAQSFSIGIWPSLLEVIIQPGKSITQVYKISNFGETDIVLTSSISTFSAADELGHIKLENLESKSEAKEWLSFQNADLSLGQNFILKAGKTQEVVLKIKIPTTASEKDHYLTLLFETIPGVSLAGQSGNLAQAKIGSNILLTVSKTGEPLKQAKTAQFSLDNFQIIDSFDKPKFLLKIQNTGRAFFKPTGIIGISGWFNQKFVLNLLPENILAQSTRQIACGQNEKAGSCQLTSGFLLGRYRATVEFGLDGSLSEYQKTITFFALPIKLIIGFITALILLFVVKNEFKLPIDRGS